MKVVRSALSSDGAPRWGYAAFMALMLYLVRRAGMKDVAGENMLSFFAAMLPTEMSHNLLAINAFVLYKLHKSRAPVFAGWLGSAAALAQGVVLLRLASICKGNLSSKHALREAMKGSDIPLPVIQRVGDLSLMQWLGVVLPLPQSLVLSFAYPGVSKTHTVAYAHVGRNRTTKLFMDVFKHKDAPDNAPIFLYVHGGGWVMGDRKNPPQPLIYQVAALGWVVCVIDYRLSPKVAFPTHLIDCKRAIAYLRRCARVNFNADPEFIVVGGESAGGHIASLVALTSGDKSLQPGFEEVDTSVRGCVDTYGVHDFKDRHGVWYQRNKSNMFVRFIELLVMQKKMSDADAEFDQASPISWLDDAHAAQRTDPVPPFLVSHGSLDTLVPFDDSYLFFEQLQRYREQCAHPPVAGVHDIFMEIPGAHHAFNYMMSPRGLAHGQAVCAFLDNLYQKTKRLDASTGATARAAVSAVEELEAHLSSTSSEPTSRL